MRRRPCCGTAYPAHRSTAMRAWLATQQSWLVERLPAYAPDLNPVEGLWSSLKAVELANLTSPTLAEVIQQAHRGIQRVRRTPHLPYSFLRNPACRSHDRSCEHDMTSKRTGTVVAADAGDRRQADGTR